MDKFQKINLPGCELTMRIKTDTEGVYKIFDIIRKRWIKLTPEEWVRQHMLKYLIDCKEYPQALLACETSISFNGLSQRCDAVAYNSNAQPLLIMEFKAQSVPLTQAVFDQISVYNLTLNVPYLFVSNGVQHVFCKVDKENNRLLYSSDIPNYRALL